MTACANGQHDLLASSSGPLVYITCVCDHTYLLSLSFTLQGTMLDTILRQVFEYRIPLIVLFLTSGTHHLLPRQNSPCR